MGKHNIEKKVFLPEGNKKHRTKAKALCRIQKKARVAGCSFQSHIKALHMLLMFAEEANIKLSSGAGVLAPVCLCSPIVLVHRSLHGIKLYGGGEQNIQDGVQREHCYLLIPVIIDPAQSGLFLKMLCQIQKIN